MELAGWAISRVDFRLMVMDFWGFFRLQKSVARDKKIVLVGA